MFVVAKQDTFFLASASIEINTTDAYEVDLIDQFQVDEVKTLIRQGVLERVWQPTDLVLQKTVGEVEDITRVDFTIIGLQKRSPQYEKGRKTSADYYLGDQLAVRKTFTDTYSDAGVLNGIRILFEWHQNDGEVGQAKDELAATLNPYEAQTMMRKRRGRVLDYLIGAAAGTPAEPYVAALLDRFATEAQQYRDNPTSTSFVDEITNTTEQPFKAILDTPLALNFTIRDSILNQIT